MLREKDYPISIPTWKDGEWVEDTVFNTKLEFKTLLLSLFKEPGQYNFDKSTYHWQEEGLKFKVNKFYCQAPVRSKDFVTYWEDQKRKSRLGTIFLSGDNTYYLAREYYFWLNFLPIFNKETAIYDAPNIWDIQYHIALYELLAELHDEHAVITKKRQIASSYYHTAKMINQYWFEEGSKCKMLASDKKYINEFGSWKMLDEYSDFLNEHTAWGRAHNPHKMMHWEQKISVNIGGKDINKGLKSSITAYTMDKDPTASVGGPARIVFYEEGGVAPTADKTYEYMRPAIQSGSLTTGLFIIAGSVGELTSCHPLKKFMLHPRENGFYAVESNLIDEKGTWGKHGLFLPEQWSMPPYIDEYGNSDVEGALKAIQEERILWKEELEPEIYRLRISQKPTNIAEAFDWREDAYFPIHLITNQIKKIEDGFYFRECVDLSENEKKEIIVTPSKKGPIREFPIKKNDVDKEGVVEIWERPIKNPPWGFYSGTIDPVSQGKTTTSHSLCSIYIYKNAAEVKRTNENGEAEVTAEKGEMVAAWCGRFDDIIKTHERLEYLIRWYNAWTIVENNVSGFIQHMFNKRLQKFLVPKNQMLFSKNISNDMNVYQDYGWRNSGQVFTANMLPYCLDFVKEVIDFDVDENGAEINQTYGIERIKDIMLLREMQEYRHGLNVDRLVSFTALTSFIKIQDSNRGVRRIVEDDGKNLDKSQKMVKLNKRPFSNIGQNKTNHKGKHRNAFRNIK